MALRTDTSARAYAPLARLRYLPFAAALALGLAVAAFERWRPAAVAPLRKPVADAVGNYLTPVRGATRGALQFGRRVSGLWSADAENAELQRRLIYSEAQLQFTREQLRRLARISGLGQWQSPPELEYLLADVVGFSTEDGAAEWIINRGELDGLEPGLPVVGQRGLAGVIREVTPTTARVQAASDPMSAIGVADSGSRARGIVFGQGREKPPQFVPENDSHPIQIGALLVTSGLGNSVYPKGILVGRVTDRGANDRGIEYGVVEPAEEFNALEEVLVIRRQGRGSARRNEGLAAFSVDMPTTATLLVQGPLPLAWPLPDPEAPAVNPAAPAAAAPELAGPSAAPPAGPTPAPPETAASAPAAESESSEVPPVPPLKITRPDAPVVNPAWFRDPDEANRP